MAHADSLADFTAALGHRFRFARLLGTGRNARVAEAEELGTGERVAVKLLHPELAASIEAERFVREMGWLERLAHPRIGTIRTAGVAQGRVYYVMPFVEGPTLRAVMAARGPLPVDEVRRHAVDLLEALDHAHRTGVVHRDVEPSNILVTAEGAVLIDFGLARAMEAAADRVTLAGVVVGTSAYMSPEQCRGDDCDGRSDLYALACVLVEALTGSPPFPHADPISQQLAHLQEPAPDVRRRRAEVPRAFAAAIGRALAKEPDARWPDAAAMRAALLND